MKRFILPFLIILFLIYSSAHAMNQLVSSGSVTQANFTVNLTNGSATVDFNSAGTLTTKLGNLISIKDSSNREIIGWAKAISGTGVTIVSAKGGSTQNWSSKNASFNVTDASGYTYQIYRCPAVVVASGSVSAANTQLSLVDGTAFAYFSGVDLTAYQSGKHLLCVYNASTGALIGMGYCSATPPAGETLGSELYSNGDFTSWTGDNPDSWTVVETGDATSKVTQNPAGQCELIRNPNVVAMYQNGKLSSSGKLMKLVFNINSISGTFAYTFKTAELFAYTSTGTKTGYFTDTMSNPQQFYGLNPCDAIIDNASLKQVLDPPSTGVRIVSAKAGSTQNWLKKGDGAVNSAITYKVYYVGE